MSKNSETRPSYIKRVERIDPEKQITDALTKRFGKKFSTRWWPSIFCPFNQGWGDRTEPDACVPCYSF